MCEAKNTDEVRAGLLSSLSYPWKWSLTGETVCSIAQQQQLGPSRWTDSQQVRWGKIRHTELDVLAIHGWLVVPSHLYLGFPSQQWDQKPSLDFKDARSRWEASLQVLNKLKYEETAVDDLMNFNQGRDAGVASARVKQTWGGGDGCLQPCRCREAEEQW